jgi:hypothetical protein
VVAEVVVAAVGRAREAAVECRPRPAVRRQWAEAWAREPQHDPRLAPRAVRVGQFALAQARAAQCVRERALVARDREPARADQAQMSEPAPGPRLAN